MPCLLLPFMTSLHSEESKADEHHAVQVQDATPEVPGALSQLRGESSQSQFSVKSTASKVSSGIYLWLLLMPCAHKADP